jgi:hypothetical protein
MIAITVKEVKVAWRSQRFLLHPKAEATILLLIPSIQSFIPSSDIS